MRPDRAVVVGHGIVACLAGADSANPPAGEKLFSHERCNQTLGALFFCDSAKQSVPGIGAAHAALFFFAVEGERVHTQLFAPEGPVKRVAQGFGLRFEPLGEFDFLECARNHRCRTLCGVDISLHFAQGDGRIGHAAVGVKDGIVRVLPALLHETFGRALLVFDKAILIAVAIDIHPFDGTLDIRPNFLQEREICGATIVRAGEHHEERRGIHAAVVTREGHFVHDGHFATPHLMQDLSRLGVALRNLFRCLRFREIFQDAFGDARRHPQTLQRGDDSIAPEHGVEPWHTGVGVRAFRIALNQHA